MIASSLVKTPNIPSRSSSVAEPTLRASRKQRHVCHVLTMPSAAAPLSELAGSNHQPQPSSGAQLVQQVWSYLTRFRSSASSVQAPQEPAHAPALHDPVERAQVAPHVHTASKAEVKSARLMSDLSNMAYDVSKLTASTLLQRHRLHLVAKSEPAVPPQPPAAQQSNIVTFRASATPPRPLCPPTAAPQPAESTHPLQWFVSDSVNDPVRVFAIQGSVTWDHWKINLAFEPAVFEAESLGVKVHRGVYQSALALYHCFLPYVQQHLASHPNAKVTFTGHSLGGSVASILLLLYVFRGVLPSSAIAPVHTYGAPAVFCDNAAAGGGHCSSCQLPCAADTDAVARRPWSSCAGLLAALGLPETAVRNVVMHNDIVPRAFVCDYSHVAQLLQQWGPAFKSHVGLAGPSPHKVLYNFLGTVHILQPDKRHKFVMDDPYHHLLPSYPALYTVHRSDPLDGCAPLDAVLHFMNSPHPLAVLQSAAAYGSDGSISRYHNPDNYTKALFGLLKRW